MVVKMVKGPNHFAPVGYAFTTLGRVSNNRPSLEDQDVDARFCKTLGSCAPGGSCSHNDNLTVLDLFYRQTITSCMPFFDDVRDEKHQRFGLTVREVVQFCLCPLKVRSNQNFCVFKTV